MHSAQGDLVAANSDLSEALSRDATIDRWWNERGNVRVALGQLDAAVHDFQQCVTLAPDSAIGYKHLAIAQLILNDVPGYRQTCAAALKRFAGSQDSRVLLSLAAIYVASPETSAPPNALAHALEALQSANAGPTVLLGALQYRQGNLAPAQATLKGAANGTEYDPLRGLFLAMIYARTGNQQRRGNCSIK